MSVKVAVRVRPFNQKEIESQSSLCINMVIHEFILEFTNDRNQGSIQ